MTVFKVLRQMLNLNVLLACWAVRWFRAFFASASRYVVLLSITAVNDSPAPSFALLLGGASSADGSLQDCQLLDLLNGEGVSILQKKLKTARLVGQP
jgi:hypothetical protein